MRSANHYTEYLNIQETAQRRVIGGRSMLKPPKRLVTIGAGTWIGDNVTILPDVEIGNGAIVGAGSVVTRSVPPYAIVVGNPARVMRYRYPEEVIELIAPVEWWTWSDEKLRANRDLFEIDLATVDPEVLRKRIAELD
jgi:virginiamycin A acetyltransferase